MTYAIIGLGKIGSAIAQAFARKEIEVTVAGRRPPEAVAPLAAKIGPSLVPRSIQEAVKADIVILAVPFATHREVARAAANWKGKIVIDAMNAFNVPPEDLDGLPSTAAVAKALPGAMLVKAFNHLAAASLAQGPTTLQGGRRVVFVSSDDDAASLLGGGPRRSAGLCPGRAGEARRGGPARPGAGQHVGPAHFPRPGEVRLMAAFRDRLPIGRSATPDEVAGAIAFLASEDARLHQWSESSDRRWSPSVQRATELPLDLRTRLKSRQDHWLDLSKAC